MDKGQGKKDRGILVLETGEWFVGNHIGGNAPTISEIEAAMNGTNRLPSKLSGLAKEVVFNTGMTGYQEIVSDPSYHEQIVCMTFPHIGNYGVETDWDESGQNEHKAAGMIMRDYYTGAIQANRFSFHHYLRDLGIPALYDIDTRKLTLTIRNRGNVYGLIAQMESEQEKPSEQGLSACRKLVSVAPRMEGRDLATECGVKEPETERTKGDCHILVLDFGIKRNILRNLKRQGTRVTLVPQSVTVEEILHLHPDGILLSNGPGDPAALPDAIATIKKLIGKIPLFGICLGHQLLALALGAQSYKLKFGHHGTNQPVRDEFTGNIYITSQNHGFCIREDALPEDILVWFRNANDGTIEGIKHKNLPIESVQFHPEAAPGPHDTEWFFSQVTATARNCV